MNRSAYQFGGVVEEERFVFVFFYKRERINAELIGCEAVVIEAIRIVRFIGCESGQTMGPHFGRCSMVTTRPIEPLILRLRKGIVLNCHVPSQPQ